jgi:4-amino-4-deoxy-L-arabinose transferase-like glycosyltransferase
MLTSDSLSSFRRIMFAITGLTCLAYAALALLQVRPDPFPFWIPGILGIISAALIFALAAVGRKNAKQAFVEGYIMDKRRAQAHAFWIAIIFLPIFGIFMATSTVALPTAFAAMGTLAGAAYLLLFTYYDAMGRE